ncbi:MAG TPA: ABC transporter permease, partial [Limnochordia bacterium]|nr:ABC transporter permease [Limnochordia bacterium]
ARGGQDPLRLFVGILAGLAAGVYFPLYTLPAWAQWLAGLIPQTWALDALRRAGMGQQLPPLPLAHALGASPIVTDFVVLIIYSAAALGLGAYAFGRAIAVARQDGRLSHWV